MSLFPWLSFARLSLANGTGKVYRNVVHSKHVVTMLMG
jgi:hypothetical protein